MHLPVATRSAGRIRWPLLALALLSAVGLAAVLGWLALAQRLAPQPERYAPGVVTGDAALERALAGPVARAYLDGFETQETWASCGPASVANLLASLGRPVPDEGTLFAHDPWAELRMRVTGMTLDQVADLLRARAVGAVSVLRDLPYARFLEHLQDSNDPANRYLVNFDRAPIFGVPVPHFSPIGGYDPEAGTVILLDVTPGYGPSLIPAPLLYAGIRTRDPATGNWRGLIRVEAAKAPDDGR